MAEALPSETSPLGGRGNLSLKGKGERDAKRETNSSLRASSLLTSDRRWCLSGIQITLLDRLTVRVSIRSLTQPSQSRVYHFFMRGGASQTHDTLLANPKSGEEYCENKVFFPLSGGY